MIDNHRFETIAQYLAGIGDIERILSRVALLSARPRDLSTLAATLQILPALQEQLADREITLHKLRKLAGIVQSSEKLKDLVATPTPPKKKEF